MLLANGDDSNVQPILSGRFCPLTRFGLRGGMDVEAQDMLYHEDRSEFSVQGTRFAVPLLGELNVRNSLAVVACARHCGISDTGIQSAFDTFAGVRRRMEVKGVSRGITVIDDFGHHPTAIRETLKALRIRFPLGRLWAIFEPRSNTTRRNIFQKQLVDAFSVGDAIVISQVARLELLPPTDRLDPERLIEDLRLLGKSADYLPNVETIIEHVSQSVVSGDAVCVFSNGGFENIHSRLLEQLDRGSHESRG